MEGESRRHDNPESISHGQSSKPHNVPLQYLREITNNFSNDRILGAGGFGVVYLGVQQNGEKVAVKKFVQSMPVFQTQFENEVDLLWRLEHPNIVRLLGYCNETQKLYMDHEGKFIFAEMTESLLCLEYLPNRSLDKYLSDKSSELNSWHMCYKIIEGICNGLHYLHEGIGKPIIHLDLKPANILLDKNMVPRITDFGLSRLLHQKVTVFTKFANGTLGYMPPEYINGGIITTKSDIFSLGVIILEIITRHRSYPDPEIVGTSCEEFVELELKRWRNMLDKAPEYTSVEMDCGQIKTCIQIGLFCVNPERTKRPTTSTIISMLQGLESTDSFFEWLRCMDCHVSSEESSTRAQVLSGANAEENNANDITSAYAIASGDQYSVEIGQNRCGLLPEILSITVSIVQRDAEENATAFNPRTYFRLFVNWLNELSISAHYGDVNFQVLTAFANAFHDLQPLRIPGWSFAWLQLVSHRAFMPKLLMSNSKRGWPLFQRLLVDLFKFMEPYLRNSELHAPVLLLYEGTMRLLLVLLHDFPEFLCKYHSSFCDVIPSSCIQMRNVILSCFPRKLRLPDPSTPNLKIDLLPEISITPEIMLDIDADLKSNHMKTEVDEYIKRQEGSSFLSDLKQKLLLPQDVASVAGTRYNVPLINSLVLYIGIQRSTSAQQSNSTGMVICDERITEILRYLVTNLDAEGRYLVLNAIANQLRYPNNHTHYFSFVILYLFAEATQEHIQEQIVRVLLERLIVKRPYPWGLLVTFLELIKNPRYDFWTRSFIRCAPEIERLFESVARSCGVKSL